MTESFRSRINDSGRVVIPLSFRKELGLGEGEEVVIARSEYGIEITPLREAVRRAQEAAARYIPQEIDLLAELRESRDQDGSLG